MGIQKNKEGQISAPASVPVFDATRQFSLIKKEIMASIEGVLESGRFVLGGKGEQFEKSFSEHVGMKYGVGVNSGTDALKIALVVLGVKEGDEVITVTNTAVPTVSAIREVGAIPVFVDIDKYFTIDPAKIEEKINSKTKVIVVVHMYGGAADMKSILAIGKKHNLKVIEDCAQAVDAKISGKKVGTFGDISCFSFYPTKNLGAYGDAGMILTNDEKIYETSKKLRMYGFAKTYYANIEGFNSRLDEVQAAILLIKLDHLKEWTEKRNEIAQFYSKNIKNKLIEIPEVRPGTEHVFHLFVIRTKKRAELKEYLIKNNIGFGVHYEFPIHLQDAYKFLNYKKGDLPESEKAADEVLSLPIFPELKKEELERVVDVINSFN